MKGLQRRATSSLGKRARLAGAVMIGILVLGWALLGTVQPIPLPTRWTTGLLEAVEQELGVPLRAERATWNGRNRLVLHAVDIGLSVADRSGESERLPFQHEPIERTAGREDVPLDSFVPIAYAERVQVQIIASDILPFWPARPRTVQVYGGQVMPFNVQRIRPGHQAASPLLGELLSATGQLHIHTVDLRLGGEAVHIANLQFSTPFVAGRLEGQVFSGQGEVSVDQLDALAVDLQAQLERVDLNLIAALTGEQGGLWDGAVAARVHVSGSVGELQADWEMSGENIVWDESPWHSQPYRVDEIAAAGSVVRGQVKIDQLGADISALSGAGSMRHISLNGIVDLSGLVDGRGATGGDPDSLALSVEVEGLQFHDDVPPLREWGVRGTGRFSGQLEGEWDHLRLSGVVEMGSGYLWSQPVDRVRGLVQLTPNDLIVEEAQITSGPAQYRLTGTVQFPQSAGSAVENPGAATGSLDLLLEAEAGRAETLLAVLGWSELPLVGGMDGVIEFAGPIGHVESRGELTLSSGVAWAQPFDEVTGSYLWNEQGLQLVDGVFRLRGGRGAFSGYLTPDGHIDINVDATGLLLQSLTAVHQASRELVSGRVDLTGHISGPLDGPQWEARVTGRRLQIGPLMFEQGSGEIGLDSTGWEVRDLVLTRSSGATYLASGWVDAPPELPALIHLLVDVQGESLEEALSLLGIQLAYPLASGRVAGRALITGELARPDGEIFLSVNEAELAGRPTGLTVEMEVAGGQVRVQHLRLGPPPPVVADERQSPYIQRGE